MTSVFDTFNTNMTSLGDEIRELGESSGTKTISQMTTLVSGANDEIDDQAEIIGDIQSALSEKTSGGGGSGQEITPANKSITASTSTQTGIDVTGYTTVSVAPTPTEQKTVTENGIVLPSTGKFLEKVIVSVPQGLPIELSTDEEMASVLSATNEGKVYKFVGVSEIYETGEYYLVEEAEE